MSFDSNILIYAADQHDWRQDRAIEVLERAAMGAGLLSLQALAEFCHVVTRKRIIASALAEAQINDWLVLYPIRGADVASLRDAGVTAREHNLPFWDAMLWATVKAAGCRFLLTEDFQDGRELGGVRFINPFNRANDATIDLILPKAAISP